MMADEKKIEVRQMRLVDIPEVIRIANQSFFEQARRPRDIGPGLIERLKNFPDWQIVALVNNEIAGFLVGRIHPRKKVPNIYWMATHPKFWGTGIGGKLLAAIEEKARENGYDRVITGTPFALKFYQKYGYKCVEIVYALTKEIAGKQIDRDENIFIKVADLEDITSIIEKLNEAESLKFLEAFFKVYEDEPDKIIVGLKNNELAGIIIGKTNLYTSELVEIIYLHVKIPELRLALINNFLYECSKKGKRWVGITTSEEKLKEQLEKDGWRDAKLPMCWTSYGLVKELGNGKNS